jgi:hypothetical protein
MESNLDLWLAQEQDAGRVWTCADHKVVGFPFRIEASCDKLSVQASQGGGPIFATVGELHATAQVFAPHTIVVRASGPLDVQAGDRQALHAAWSAIEVGLTFGSEGLDHAYVVANSPQARVVDARSALQSGRAARVEADFTAVAGFPPEATPYKFALKLDGGQFDLLDQWVGSADPATIKADGVVSDLGALDGDNLSEIIESWRAAGGAIDITDTHLQKGSIDIDANGRLSLDAQHRLQGQIGLAGTGLDPILARYGVSKQTAALGGILSSFLSASAAPANRSPDALHLSLKLDKGRVGLGPVQLPIILKPLY